MGANKVKTKTKELQFSSRGRVGEGDMPHPAQSAEAIFFFSKSKRCKRQIIF